MKDNANNFETLAIHAGQAPDPTTGAIMTPVYQTSTFVQASPGVFKGRYDYSRSANPTRTALEANIAALEGGKFGLAFSSGCGALDCILHSLKAGDHVLVSDDVYGGTFRLFDRIFKQLGLEFSMVDMTNPAAVREAFRPHTQLAVFETPTNPTLKVIDIAAIAEVCKQKKVLLGVDNTFATPYLQSPLKLGADIVWHSTTKYIGGHSDVVGGVIIVNDQQLHERLQYIQNAVGAVPSAWDCFLLLRSTKTLHVRMDRHCDNAEKIVAYLSGHKRVKQVYYPGLETHPQHKIAKNQMKRFGGMVSLELAGDLAYARKFLERVQIFSLAESLGGVESLIEHPAIMTHASIPADQRAALGIVDGFVRLSVGIEHADDLIADLEQALA